MTSCIRHPKICVVALPRLRPCHPVHVHSLCSNFHVYLQKVVNMCQCAEISISRLVPLPPLCRVSLHSWICCVALQLHLDTDSPLHLSAECKAKSLPANMNPPKKIFTARSLSNSRPYVDSGGKLSEGPHAQPRMGVGCRVHGAGCAGGKIALGSSLCRQHYVILGNVSQQALVLAKGPGRRPSGFERRQPLTLPPPHL